MKGTWEVEETKDGTFDVFFNRRIVQYDVPSIEEAERIVQGNFYILVELDGYRTNKRVR